jgi:hypothetical protein
LDFSKAPSTGAALSATRRTRRTGAALSATRRTRRTGAALSATRRTRRWFDVAASRLGTSAWRTRKCQTCKPQDTARTMLRLQKQTPVTLLDGPVTAPRTAQSETAPRRAGRGPRKPKRANSHASVPGAGAGGRRGRGRGLSPASSKGSLNLGRPDPRPRQRLSGPPDLQARRPPARGLILAPGVSGRRQGKYPPDWSGRPSEYRPAKHYTK